MQRAVRDLAHAVPSFIQSYISHFRLPPLLLLPLSPLIFQTAYLND